MQCKICGYIDFNCVNPFCPRCGAVVFVDKHLTCQVYRENSKLIGPRVPVITKHALYLPFKEAVQLEMRNGMTFRSWEHQSSDKFIDHLRDKLIPFDAIIRIEYPVEDKKTGIIKRSGDRILRVRLTLWHYNYLELCFGKSQDAKDMYERLQSTIREYNKNFHD